jgi:hypothetical protein
MRWLLHRGTVEVFGFLLLCANQVTTEEDWLTDLQIQLTGASTNAASFQIEKEDHTLGNALRYFINKK